MLTISKVALVAAVLSLAPAGLMPALADDASSSSQAPADTSTTTGGFSVQLSIPTVTAVDSTMDEAAIRDALTGGFMKHVDDLAKLNATTITIPEIDLTMNTVENGTAMNTQAVYKDLVLSSVKNGVAASVSIGSSQSTNPEGTFVFNGMSLTNFDIGGTLALYSLVNGDATAAMKPLYTAMAFSGGTFSGPKVSCSIGQVATTEADARPLKVSIQAMMDAANQVSAGGDTPPPAAFKTVVSFFTDLLQAFKTSPLTVGPISCKGTGDDGKPGEFDIGGISMDGLQPGLYPAITVKGLKFSDTDTTVSLDEAVAKATDLSQPIAAVNAAGDDLSPAWFQANYRKVIPAWAGLSFSGLSVDTPNPDTPSEKLSVKVDKFDLSFSDYVNGVPSKISNSASGVDVPLEQNSTDSNIQMLEALGINRVTMGYEFSASWDKANQAINIDKISFNGQDLGGFAVAAVLGNATADLFDSDANTESNAALGLTVKSIKIDANDAGIGDKLMPMLAQQQGADAATYRAQAAATAEAATIEMLGSTDAARQLGAALSDFVAGKAKSITVNITSKDPAGVAMPALMAASDDPSTLQGQVDITGSAQ
ncbi:MAG TPA: hypothetical protein VHZ56_11475 [Devosia sp.]|nr:hypothetical protein [Devosia sp.]